MGRKKYYVRKKVNNYLLVCMKLFIKTYMENSCPISSDQQYL